VNPTNDRTNELVYHRPLESSIKTLPKNNELNCAESEFSKRGTRNCLVLILQQIEQNHPTLRFLREKSSEATSEEEKHRQTHH
jgi:hypothetical protein